MSNELLIQIKNAKKYFPVMEGFNRKQLKAVDDVSLDIYKGETLGLVGESGCGKSTLGRVALRLFDITEGEVLYKNENIYDLSESKMRELRSKMQIVFQNPYACLNPRMRIEDIIAEPLRFNSKDSAKERRLKVIKTMEDVGLSEDMARRFPHELSGGQQQRVGIARAIISHPAFIVCDEAVSALDVSVQAQVLNLLKEMKEKYALTYLFISHNLAVVKHMCDRIAVMYLGRIVELGTSEQIFENPRHPYTKALISAIPDVDNSIEKERIILKGDIPSPINVPDGCAFSGRCNYCKAECTGKVPELVEVESGHFVRCIL